jgi:glycosyltransferase involved in cell wall biosynthesis
MRIAHVTDYYLPRLGGIEMQVHDLAVRQRAAGHQAFVVTQTPEARGLGTADPDPDWVRRIDSVVAQRAMRPFATVPGALEVLLTGDFDVVHVHASLVSPFAMLAARALAKARIPTVVTVHSLWSRTGPVPDLFWGAVGHHRWPVVWSAVSQTAAKQVGDTLGLDVAVAVLPNGIDPAAWRTEPAPRSPDTVTITSVMRLSRRKRPMPLLRILRDLRGRVSPSIGLHAILVGDGPLRPKIQAYLQAHEMEDWVSLPGRLERDDIAMIFAHSDLYVAPAVLESFGIAALEARSAGLPVVASDKGGMGEFISDGTDGFLSGSDDEMLHALTALVHDRHTRERIAAHNRAVPPAVNWDYVLDRAEVLYTAARRRVAAEAVRRSSRNLRLVGRAPESRTR